jgi:hypothetical protein
MRPPTPSGCQQPFVPLDDFASLCMISFSLSAVLGEVGLLACPRCEASVGVAFSVKTIAACRETGLSIETTEYVGELLKRCTKGARFLHSCCRPSFSVVSPVPRAIPAGHDAPPIGCLKAQQTRAFCGHLHAATAVPQQPFTQPTVSYKTPTKKLAIQPTSSCV